MGVGQYVATLIATNAYGADSKTVVINVLPRIPPEIIGPLQVSGKQGEPISFTIDVSNKATMFTATGLPDGLQLKWWIGEISGVPTVAGRFNVSITATNPFGGDAKALVIDLASGVPRITSSLSASGRQGSAFSYSITASNSPTGFVASDLPSGLSLEGKSGRISGVPNVSGTFSATITATNNYGSDSRTLWLTISSCLPTITSPLYVAGTEMASFTYQITAGVPVLEFGTTNLPAGLTLNPQTGVISGKPVSGGDFWVTISARNACGTASANLHLHFNYAPFNFFEIENVTGEYSSPYLVDIEFSLRSFWPELPLVRPLNQLQVVAIEDGRPVSGTETAVVLERANKKQFKCYLVLDYTASIAATAANGDRDGDGLSDAVESMESAAKTFIQQQPREAQFGIYEFHREDRLPQRVSKLTSDRAVLNSTIDGIWQNYVQWTPASTRCWDAIYSAVGEFGAPSRDEQRYVVFLSDGNDESSSHTIQQIVALANSKGVRLYCVGFGRELNTGNLNTLTSQTRGRYYAAQNPSELAAQFAMVGKEIDGQYLLRWATLKRGTNTFMPSFRITCDGQTRTMYDRYPPLLPRYSVSRYAASVSAGALRLQANADANVSSVILRAVYTPRYVQRIRIRYRANFPCSPELKSIMPGEILSDWNLTETDDGAGGKVLEITSPNPVPQALGNSIPYGALGNLVQFNFEYLRNGIRPFSRFAVDNTIYGGEKSFVIENGAAFIGPGDTTPPVLSINSPVANSRIVTNGGLITVRGLASDASGIASNYFSLNGSAFAPASGANVWTASVQLRVGTNTLQFYAVDRAGNRSAIKTVRVNYVVTSPLTLVVSGGGAVIPNRNGLLQDVGVRYSISAQAFAGNLFSNWMSSGTILGTAAALTYAMATNFVLQANFVPNPFIPLKGSYVGLFRPPTDDSVSGTNAGALTLTLADSGGFSGSLRTAGKTHAFSGKFDLSRRATINITRLGNTPLAVNLGFDGQTITGEVSTVGWAADLLVLRRATATSNLFAGRYSMVVMGQHDATDSPPGDSPLAVSVSAPSAVSVSGTMADGSTITLATGHSAEGTWPFYASLYGGRGLVIGWMSCATNQEPQEVLWVKPPDAASRNYPAGFRDERDAAIQRYLPPALKQTATSWTLGRLLIGGGNLPAPLEAEVLVTNNLIKRLSGSVSNLSLTITNSNGRFGGSFLHPVTRKATPLKGILVQGLPWLAPADQVAVGGGWFLGTNQAGYLWIEPKP